MKINILFFLFIIAFGLTSCFDMREDIQLRKDGSGTYSLLFDMSKNKEMMNFVRESNNEDPNTKNLFAQADTGFIELTKALNQMPGISSAKSVKEDLNYIYGFTFNFKDINSLNDALISITEQSTKSTAPNKYYAFDKKNFEKVNYFYLNVFLDALMSGGKTEEEAKGIDVILGTASYVFNFQYEGKIKTATSPASVQDNKSAKIVLPLLDLRKNNLPIGTKMKLK